MDGPHDEESKPLNQENTPSDFSADSSSTFVASPFSGKSVQHRQGFHRIPSMQEQDTSYHGARAEDEDNGLGIQNMKGSVQGPSIEISYSGESTPAMPGSAGFMLSPSLSRSNKKNYSPLGETSDDDWNVYHGGRARSPSLFRPLSGDSDTETLRRAQGRTSTLSPYGPTGTMPCFAPLGPFLPVFQQLGPFPSGFALEVEVDILHYHH